MSRRGPHFVPIEDVPGPGLSPRTRELVAVAVLGASIYVLLALLTFAARPEHALDIPRGAYVNLGGSVGYYVAHAMVFVLGLASWAIPCFGVVFGISQFVGRNFERPTFKALGVVVFVAMLALWFAGPDVAGAATSGGGEATNRLAPHGPGGRFGANLSPKLTMAFGGSGRVLLLVFGTLISLLLATEWMFSEMLERLLARLDRAWRSVLQPRPAVAGGGALDADDTVGERETPRPSGRGAFALKLPDRLLRLLPAGWTVGRAARASSDVHAIAATDPAAEEAAPPSTAVANKRGRKRATTAPADSAEVGAADDAETIETAIDAFEVVETDRTARRAGDGALDEAADADENELDGDDSEANPSDDDEVDAGAADDADAQLDDEGVSTATDAARGARPRRKLGLARSKRGRRKRAHRPRQPELPFAVPYPFPPIELFREPPPRVDSETEAQLDENKLAIERRLASFKIDVNVVAASVGPAVTQYELELAEGIKLSRLTSYEADLAAALKAVSVRVVAPIPGKGTVGVEVPNEQRQIVVMRELLEEGGPFDDKAIPLLLGRDVTGAPIVEDLAKMPHLLIAGTTGSGKSVCINSILLSILMLRTPQQVRLVLVDPKMVELQNYKNIPHLACAVVTNMKKAPGVLEWAVAEMERRYELLSQVGVNHIRGYNALGQDEVSKRLGRPVDAADAYLPYQVLVIDELADLMAVAQKEVEESIQRLAQKSRAVGLHVILATQRPSTDVITGVIKANLPCQIAFKVNRKIDSRVILDANGAEKLLGHGDMLYVPTSSHQLVRAQGTYVAEEEIHAVVRYLEEHGPAPTFIPDLVQTETGRKRGMRDRDDLYVQAVEVILGQQRGSATLLQRALSVGYTRATRLLEMMEEDGVVGPFVGSRSRDVLLTLDEWKAREAAIAAELAAIEDGLDDDEFEEGELDEGELDEGELDDGELDEGELDELVGDALELEGDDESDGDAEGDDDDSDEDSGFVVRAAAGDAADDGVPDDDADDPSEPPSRALRSPQS